MATCTRERFILILLVFLPQSITGMDVDCNFDQGFCNWEQDNRDQFDWSRTTGETPTAYTGPHADHTSGNGSYIYIETTPSKLKNKRARLISPEQQPGQYCLSFWYNMYGAHIRHLKIFSKVGNNLEQLFRVSDTQGQQWIQEQLDLNVIDKYKVVIHAKVRDDNDHGLGDIAVDDVVMRPGLCQIVSTTTTTTAAYTSTTAAYTSTTAAYTSTTAAYTSTTAAYTSTTAAYTSTTAAYTSTTASYSSTTVIPTTPSTRSTSAVSSTSANRTTSLSTVSPTVTETANASSKPSTRTTIGSTTVNSTENYPTETSSESSDFAAIIDKEEETNVAVYVSVPFAVIVVALTAVMVFVCWRRMQQKSISDIGGKGDKQMFAVANNAYNNHELDDTVMGTFSNMHRSLSADNGYVEIQEITAEHEYSSIITGTTRPLNVRSDYAHINAKTQHAHNADEAYSHLAATHNVPNAAATDTMHSHIGSGDRNIPTKRINGEEDDSYNTIQLHPKLPVGTEYEQEPDYDHAVAGQHALTDTSEDDYAHLHDRGAMPTTTVANGNKTRRLDIDNEVTSAEIEYANDIMNAARNGEALPTKCVQGVGCTQSALVEEPEDQSGGDNDRHYFVLEKLNKNCDDDTEDERPYSHDYFVLEKTEA